MTFSEFLNAIPEIGPLLIDESEHMRFCTCPECETTAYIAWLERTHPNMTGPGPTPPAMDERFSDVIWPIMCEVG